MFRNMKIRTSSVLFLTLLVGCSESDSSGRPKTYTASGTVTLNGQPLEGATVNFYPMEGSGSAIGMTDANGKYTLTTYTSNDGAVPGQYKVSITKYEGGAAPKATNTPPPGTLAPGDLDAATYAQPNEGAAAAGAAAPTGPKNLVPEKYSNADSSGLRGTIDPKDGNENNFDLK